MSSAILTDPTLRTADHIVALVGHTPLLHLRRFSPSPLGDVFAKLEYLNPGGSVKDRAALGSMIEAAELSDRVKYLREREMQTS